MDSKRPWWNHVDERSVQSSVLVEDKSKWREIISEWLVELDEIRYANLILSYLILSYLIFISYLTPPAIRGFGGRGQSNPRLTQNFLFRHFGIDTILIPYLPLRFILRPFTRCTFARGTKDLSQLFGLPRMVPERWYVGYGIIRGLPIGSVGFILPWYSLCKFNTLSLGHLSFDCQKASVVI